MKAGWTAFSAFLAIRPCSWCLTELGQSRFARPPLQRVRCWCSRRTRTSAFPPPAGIVQLSSNCIVRKNGLAACGEFSEHAQRDLPANLGLLQVFAGHLHTCAVRADGQLVCFGNNRDRQCDCPVWQSRRAIFILVQCVQMVSSSALEATNPGSVTYQKIWDQL